MAAVYASPLGRTMETARILAAPHSQTVLPRDGLREIPIEERSAREVTHLTGRDASGELVEVQLVPDGSGAANPAFDVTPARLVTGLITERGVVAADEKALRALAMKE